MPHAGGMSVRCSVWRGRSEVRVMSYEVDKFLNMPEACPYVARNGGGGGLHFVKLSCWVGEIWRLELGDYLQM